MYVIIYNIVFILRRPYKLSPIRRLMAIAYSQLKDALTHSKRPLYFYDDDPDGLCAYITLHRASGEGKGIILKSRPLLDEKFLPRVTEYEPDAIFVLDIANMSEQFVEQAKVPIHWVDHHGNAEPPQGVHYYNPRREKKPQNICTTALCYNAVGGKIWIAGVGMVADWMLIPSIAKEVQKHYPQLLPANVKKPEQALYETPLGKLVRIFSFVIKGETKYVHTMIRHLTTIEEPTEILEQTTEIGKEVYDRYIEINKDYEPLLNSALENYKKEDPLLQFLYPDTKNSFTSDLSNELLYKHPDKVIIVGRKKDGEYRMSLRNAGRKKLNLILAKCLTGLQGYGGGHEHAVGCSVAVNDYDEFLNRLRKEIS